MTLTKSLDRVRIFHSADSNEQIGQVTKNFTMANFEYLRPHSKLAVVIFFVTCPISSLQSAE